MIFDDFGGVLFLFLGATIFTQYWVSAPFQNRPDKTKQLKKFERPRVSRKIRRPPEVSNRDGLLTFEFQLFRKSSENKVGAHQLQESRKKKHLVTWTLWAPYSLNLLFFFSENHENSVLYQELLRSKVAKNQILY